jgi:hypothetical protein
MAACFGERFYAMWRNVDEVEMQVVWSEGLRGITRENLMRGVSAMLQRRTPPTLGEFIELCQPVPAMYRQNTLALSDNRRASPAVVAENMTKIRAILASRGLPKSAPAADETGIEWAFRIERAADVDASVPLHKLRFAQEAIRAWCDSHHCTRDALDENGKWKGGSRVASSASAGEVSLPPRVPSPHIYGEYEREPGEDDE